MFIPKNYQIYDLLYNIQHNTVHWQLKQFYINIFSP